MEAVQTSGCGCGGGAGAKMKIEPERSAQIEAGRDEVQALMATGVLPGDRFVQVSKEDAELEPVAAAAGDVRRLRAEAESLEHMTTEADAELRAMAAEELADNKAKLEIGRASCRERVCQYV